MAGASSCVCTRSCPDGVVDDVAFAPLARLSCSFDSGVESSDAFGTFPPAASGQFTWEGYGASTKTQAEARDAPLSGVRSGFDRTYACW